MTLALDKKLSAPEKKARLSSAHINFRESVEIWNKLQDRKAIPKYNEVDVKASQTKLEECERTVAELVS
jgi:hypothetical protein